MKTVALALVIALGLALAAPAAGALRYSTVARNTWVPGGGTPPSSAHVLLRKGDVARVQGVFARRDVLRLARVDFRRYVAVVVVTTLPDPCHSLGVTKLVRAKRTLVVHAEQVAPAGVDGCIQVIATGYHVVKALRSAFAGRLPERAVVRLSPGTRP